MAYNLLQEYERMATLIPAVGACTSRITGGERRIAERLEQKLNDDYLRWYDIPVGPKYSHPDFVVMQPRRGLMNLEIKDWRLASNSVLTMRLGKLSLTTSPKVSSTPLNKPENTPPQIVNRAHSRFAQPDG